MDNPLEGDNLIYSTLFGLFNKLSYNKFLECDFKRSYQPTQQGRPNKTTVYFHKIDEKQYGFPSQKIRFNKKEEFLTSEYEQTLETTFKFSVTKNIEVNDPYSPTHSDVLKRLSFYLHSDEFIEELTKQKIQILRIGQIKILYIENDQGLFEESPTFDLTLIHTEGYVEGTQRIKRFKSNIERVRDLPPEIERVQNANSI